MLTKEQFLVWCDRQKLSLNACNLISGIRCSEPSRRVASRRGNVSGDYPSNKMGCTIQFESHTVELAAIKELEHDSQVLEYYDQPGPIKLSYVGKGGKKIAFFHTPDYFVIRDRRAGWEECKTEDELLQHAANNSNRYLRDESGVWCCPPGEFVAEPLGLYYRVRSDKDVNRIYQRNLQFLDDYLRAESLNIKNKVLESALSIVSAEPGITLKDLLSKEDLDPDDIYTFIATDSVYVDLHAAALAEPERVHIYSDEATAKAYTQIKKAVPTSANRPTFVDLAINNRVEWDGSTWTIVNIGQTAVWLTGDSNKHTELELGIFEDMVKRGKILGVDCETDQSAEINSIISSANKEDLCEANRRLALVLTYLNGESLAEGSLSERTIRLYVARYHKADALYGKGYLGLIPRKRSRGNRKQKIPQETRELMKSFIEDEYETLKQKSKSIVYGSFLKLCDQRSIAAPSYKTFIAEIKRRPKYEQVLKRQGKRAAYKYEPFYHELNQTTPRHGDRPFEICHIDHTELDVELVCSTTGRNLGRPWATIMTDAYSRRFLAVYITYDPPSYRACMMSIRECVRRHGRFPQIIVVDGGKEFSSIYFDTLLAHYECVKKIRPPAKSRFGSVCERLFGTLNTRFIHNLQGNTQITRNVRQVTKYVNPKNQAVLDLGSLYSFFCEFAYQVYDTTDHPALGQSPRESFTAGMSLTGNRPHRIIPYDSAFLMFTLPTTRKGYAKVLPGRGVKINYLTYWCDSFRNPEIERTNVDVRYDPFDAGTAYAFVKKQWVQCRSEYYSVFRGRSEREIMLATKELLKRRKQTSQQANITARRMAIFLEAVESHEALNLQRLQDREMRSILENTNGNRKATNRTDEQHTDSSSTDDSPDNRTPDASAESGSLGNRQVFEKF